MCGYIKHGSFQPFFLKEPELRFYMQTRTHTRKHVHFFLKIKHFKYVNHEDNSKICVNKWINPLYTKIFTNCRTLINCVFFFISFIIKQIWRLYQKLCKKIRDFSVCFPPALVIISCADITPFFPSWSLSQPLPAAVGDLSDVNMWTIPFRVAFPTGSLHTKIIIAVLK